MTEFVNMDLRWLLFGDGIVEGENDMGYTVNSSSQFSNDSGSEMQGEVAASVSHDFVDSVAPVVAGISRPSSEVDSSVAPVVAGISRPSSEVDTSVALLWPKTSLMLMI